jgi:D-alanine transaminase
MVAPPDRHDQALVQLTRRIDTMPLDVCFLNGEYQALKDARVSPLDRGFLFADAVYEVLPVYGGRPFRLRQHLDRLARSLAEIGMPAPLTHKRWARVCAELIERNGVHGHGGHRDGAEDLYIYIQVTRGAEYGRNHAWPEGLRPTLFAYVSALPALPPEILARGVAAITAEDTRWARRDIKSTSLLANILLKKRAADAGAFETIMLERGFLTEGSSTTVHVLKAGILHTPPNGHSILPGTTRAVVEELAARIGLPAVSEFVTEAELRSADEVWLAFSTRGVLAVTRLDGKPVGTGSPGPLFKRIHAAFNDYIGELAALPVL